jgi:hypothetical protein
LGVPGRPDGVGRLHVAVQRVWVHGAGGGVGGEASEGGGVVRYRVGESGLLGGRTIFRQLDVAPSDADEFVAVFEQEVDAIVFVAVMNQAASDMEAARPWWLGGRVDAV